MIETYQQAKIKDLYGKEVGITIDVNWNPGDEKSNKCKVLRLSFGGKEFYVDKKDFLSFLWIIGDTEEQMKMIPQKKLDVKWYQTVVSVKAKRDIRKGENITFPIKLTIPSEEKEIIGSLTKDILEGKKKIILSN